MKVCAVPDCMGTCCSVRKDALECEALDIGGASSEWGWKLLAAGWLQVVVKVIASHEGAGSSVELVHAWILGLVGFKW